MQIITWKTGTGKEAKVTVELLTSKTVDADGHKVEVPCCEIQIFARVEGMGVVGAGRPMKVNHPVAVAKIGQLALTAENYQRVQDAIAEIEASPEWQAKIEKQRRTDKALDEVEEHRGKMRKIMGY